MESSFEDMSTVERFIKHSFVVTVPAYFFATQTAGGPIPIKRYVSSPSIEFKNASTDSISLTDVTVENKYLLGSDDPTLPLNEQNNKLEDQRDVGWHQTNLSPYNSVDPKNPGASAPSDPAYSNLPRGHRLLKIKTTNAKGETIYTGYDLDELL